MCVFFELVQKEIQVQREIPKKRGIQTKEKERYRLRVLSSFVKGKVRHQFVVEGNRTSGRTQGRLGLAFWWT